MARVATECLSTEGVPQTASIVMEAVCMQTYLLSPRPGVLKFVGRRVGKDGLHKQSHFAAAKFMFQ